MQSHLLLLGFAGLGGGNLDFWAAASRFRGVHDPLVLSVRLSAAPFCYSYGGDADNRVHHRWALHWTRSDFLRNKQYLSYHLLGSSLIHWHRFSIWLIRDIPFSILFPIDRCCIGGKPEPVPLHGHSTACGFRARLPPNFTLFLGKSLTTYS